MGRFSAPNGAIDNRYIVFKQFSLQPIFHYLVKALEEL